MMKQEISESPLYDAQWAKNSKKVQIMDSEKNDCHKKLKFTFLDEAAVTIIILIFSSNFRMVLHDFF